MTSVNKSIYDRPPLKQDVVDKVVCSINTQAQEEYEYFLSELKLDFIEKMKGLPKQKEKLEDFEKLNTLGIGTFGRVILIKHGTTGNYYAMKCQEKEKLFENGQIGHVLQEKRILQSMRFPFVVHMEFCFKDNDYIYYVMPVLLGGEMFSHIRRMKYFNESLAKFYTSQIVLTLEYLHNLDLIHRDIKPENILLDQTGYIKVTDFGFCKFTTNRCYTLCGTPEYIAPEIILSKGYSKGVDWWSTGVLLFEMVAGYPPFYDREHMALYEKVVAGKYKFASHFSTDLKDLLRNILQVDITRRYGVLKNGVIDIKNHRWFIGLDWTAILNQQVEPPFIPKVKNPADTSNFTTDIEEPLKCSPTNQYAKEFAEF